MKKNNPSDGILVFDRYYSKKPVAAVLAVLRILFCSAFSASAMLFIFSQYNFQTVSLGYIAAVSALTAAVLATVFLFVKKRYAVPVMLILSLIIVFFKFEILWERVSYFVDEAMLLVDGRFLAPRPYLIHEEHLLTVFNSVYASGMLLGSFILCALYSLLCAVAMDKRIRVIIPSIGFIILWIPCLLAESFDFDIYFVPVALLVAAAAAISANYKNGLAVVRSGASLYRQQVREEDARFIANTNNAGVLKRTSMRICHYSKYTSTGIYSAMIFAMALFVGMTVFDEGAALNYRKLYDQITEFFEEDADVTINEDDTVSDYFSSPEDKDDGLSITSPGRSNKSVISVTFSGDEPIYLRGDIGVYFTGTDWVTPVNNDAKWAETSFHDLYRPSELRILNILLDELTEGTLSVASESNVTIEYLCETDVVFLPAYTGDYAFYNNPNFDVYGDYCVRVSDSADNYVNSVQCTAILHDFGNDAEKTISDTFSVLDEYGIYIDDLYSAVVGVDTTSDITISEYKKYINDTYLDVPEQIGEQLSAFMWNNGISRTISDLYYADSTSLFRYQAAAIIDEYLKKNYTYSLANTNRGEGAIMQFLTETKSGHCSLYASAMTLMLRELGIPARYCTGFAVHPETITGNTKIFKEKDLHAWVEVYLDEFGWVTFDPTSAAVNALAADSTSEAERNPVQTTTTSATSVSKPIETETKESHSTNETDNAPTDPHQPPDSGNSSPEIKIPTEVILAVAAVLSILISICLVIWHYSKVRKNAEDAVKHSHSNSGSDVYDCIIDILYYRGLSPEAGELPTDFYKRADKQFNAGLFGNADILEAAAFGGEDNDKLSELLKALFNASTRQVSTFKRYRIYKIIIRHLGKRYK